MVEPVFISYAQTMEDVMLWRALRYEEPGFYIDAGAADPNLLSITRAFYERGWRGLSVEPLPEQAARLRDARPRDVVVEAALGEREGEATFHRVSVQGDPGLSTLDPELAARAGGAVETLTVSLTTLAALCREHVRGEVHFLKIDVEGAEAAVLRGMDFAAVRPWIVLIEAVMPHTGAPADAETDQVLQTAGYVPAYFDGLNRFYLAEERRAALAEHFQVPPNPFDNYRVADLPTATRLATLATLAEARLAAIGRLEAELAAARATPSLPPLSPPLMPLPERSAAARRRPAAALFAWRLLRPAVRPIAWRLRTFLIGGLRDELRADQAQVRQQLAAVTERLDRLDRKVIPDLDESLVRSAERLLLTMTVDRP